MQTGQFASAPDAVRLIIAKEGFGGMYAVYMFFPDCFSVCFSAALLEFVVELITSCKLNKQ